MRRLPQALHRKLREGFLTPEDHAEVALQFRDDCEAGLWRWLPMGDALAAAAAEKLRTLPASVFIRGADALHLLCAAENGFTEVFSHDRHFLAAAHRALLEIELRRLADKLGTAFDEDWASGKLTKENIQEAILEHRRKHPYR